jgi:uncharacterized protein YgiM (DUF1202 family)
MRRLTTAAFLIIAIFMSISTVQPAAAQSGAVWDAKYYDTPTLSGPEIITRRDNVIAFDWGSGSPGPNISNDNFSVRWGTDVFFPAGTYRFWALADDNVRVNIGFAITPQIDTFANPAVNQVVSADVNLPEGTHHIQVDYRELSGNARVYVTWANLATNPTGPNFPAPVQQPIPVSGGGWTAQYYANQSLAGSPSAILSENSPSHDWGSGSPINNIGSNNFSVRWTSVQYLNAGRYRVTVRADDGVRLFVNGSAIINEWHGASGQTYTADFTLGTGQHNFMIEYYEDNGAAFIDYNLSLVANAAPPTSTPVIGQPPIINLPGNWLATYYNSRSLTGAPAAILSDIGPNHDWGQGSPVASVSNDNFSARWTSTQTLSAGSYRITARADDGLRVYVNGTLLINEWHDATASTYVADIALQTGTHTFTVDYYEAGGRAFIDFNLGLANTGNTGTGTASGTATVTAFRLNVREQPTTSSGVITQINRGETYPVIGCNADRNWWLLNINGTRGWVFGSFVNVSSANCASSQPAPTNPNPSQTGYTVTTLTDLNIRSQATTGSALLGLLRTGQTVAVVGRNANSTWWQIQNGGITGWVSASFARIQSGADINRIPITG